jgi:plasmid stabilization system protein ParE
MYQLIIRPEAEQDIDDAYDWYEANQPRLGSEFVRAVDVAIGPVSGLAVLGSWISGETGHRAKR